MSPHMNSEADRRERTLPRTPAPALTQHLLALSIAALSLALLPACETTPDDEPGTACTAIGCADAYSVDFEMTGGWSAGDYEVSVELDGEATVCKATLPFASCDAAATCAGGSDVLLKRWGCKLDPAQHKLGGVTILNTQPKTVKVKVSRSAEVLGEGSWTPTFTTSRPNGPGCEPVCVQAPSEKLSLK